jgi:hypothetical protein
MPATCPEINDSLQLFPCPPGKAAEARQAGAPRYWLDLGSCEPGEVADWLDRLGVRGLARRLCLEARDRTGFYPLKEEILLVLPALAKGEASRGVVHLSCLCRENLLLTVHDGSAGEPQGRARLQDADTWLPEGSIPGLISALVMGLSLDLLQRTVALRRAIVDLDERMDRAPDTVEPDEINSQRSELLTVGAVVRASCRPCGRSAAPTGHSSSSGKPGST